MSTEKKAEPTANRALRQDVPKIRTAEAVIHKHEQIQDALERGSVTAKQAEQMGQNLKGILNVARLELQYWSLVAKFGRKAPVPRSALLRNVIGLSEQPQATDGDKVRGLMAEA